MKDLKLTDTGGHYLDGEKITDGGTRVYGRLMDGEIGFEVRRTIARGEVRWAEAYLSVKQAKKLRKHLKRLIAKAGE